MGHNAKSSRLADSGTLGSGKNGDPRKRALSRNVGRVWRTFSLRTKHKGVESDRVLSKGHRKRKGAMGSNQPEADGLATESLYGKIATQRQNGVVGKEKMKPEEAGP